MKTVNESRALFEVRQGAYIFNKKKQLLLLQNTKGTWGIVGGHLEYKEKPIDSLLREIKEETSSDVEIIDFVNTRTVDKSFIVVYAAIHKSGNVKTSDEHLDWKWVDLDDLDKYELIFPELKREAKEALKKVS